MNTTKNTLRSAAVLAGALLAGTAAHAGGNVYWSIGIHAPLDPYGASIGTTISNAPRPVYRPVPVVYAPPPVLVAPAPVYYAPPPAVVYARPVHVLPAPVYVPYPQRHSHRHRDRYRHGRDD